jgi:hypothetical protein
MTTLSLPGATNRPASPSWTRGYLLADGDVADYAANW